MLCTTRPGRRWTLTFSPVVWLVTSLGPDNNLSGWCPAGSGFLFFISPVPFAMAAVPIAMYLIMLGAFRLRSRPLVTTGWRDVAALGIALMGLVAIGPVQLFFPTYAAARFSGWVWIILLALYLLTLLLVMLSCRPRLIVYGLGEDAFFQVLQEAAAHVDPEASWHGQTLTFPNVGMQLITEPTGARGVQQAVILSGPGSIQPWLQLESELVKRCAQATATERSWTGFWLIVGGLAILLIALWRVAADPAAALVELRAFFDQ